MLYEVEFCLGPKTIQCKDSFNRPCELPFVQDHSFLFRVIQQHAIFSPTITQHEVPQCDCVTNRTLPGSLQLQLIQDPLLL